ncbi:UNVERIFIED_CONTAM: hypothetical protein FKN15_020065 [Acipenser sinensis]
MRSNRQPQVMRRNRQPQAMRINRQPQAMRRNRHPWVKRGNAGAVLPMTVDVEPAGIHPLLVEVEVEMEPAGIHPLLVEVAEAEAALAALLLAVVETEAAPTALLLVVVETETAPAALFLVVVETEAAPAALLLVLETVARAPQPLTLETALRHKRSACIEIKESEKIFTELIRSIEKIHTEVIELIGANEKAAVNQAEGRMKKLEQEIAELRQRNTELKQLSETEDHIHFLQNFQSLCAPPEAGDLPSVTVNTDISFGSVRKAVSELKDHIEHFCKGELVKITTTGSDNGPVGNNCNVGPGPTMDRKGLN